MKNLMSLFIFGLIFINPAFGKISCEIFNEKGTKIYECDLGYYVEMSGLGKVAIGGCALDVSFNPLYETQVSVSRGVVRVNHNVNGEKDFTSVIDSENNVGVNLPNGNVVLCSGISELKH
jgi:hypothetical protein